MKRKAPEKQCPDCGEMCHARRSSCKDCGFIFFKKKQAVQGMFEVVEIHDENKRSCGIIGRKIFAGRVRSSYREYIYMGEPYFDKAFSLHKRPHKIRVIKLKEESV